MVELVLEFEFDFVHLGVQLVEIVVDLSAESLQRGQRLASFVLELLRQVLIQLGNCEHGLLLLANHGVETIRVLRLNHFSKTELKLLY